MQLLGHNVASGSPSDNPDNIADLVAIIEAPPPLLLWRFVIPAVLVALIVALIATLEIEKRYMAEIRHHVEAVASQMAYEIDHGLDQDPKLKAANNHPDLVAESLKNLVRQARWDSVGPNPAGFGYVFLWEEVGDNGPDKKVIICQANGGFPDTCERKGLKDLPNDQQRGAIRDLSKAASNPDPEQPKNAIYEALEDYWDSFEILIGTPVVGKYVNYSWPKPNLTQKEFPKIGYAKKFSTQGVYKNWWVGAGVYKDSTIYIWALMTSVVLAVFGGVHLLFYLSVKRRLLTLVLDSAAESILITNKDYKVEFANKKALQLFGYSIEELRKMKDVKVLIPPSLQKEFDGDMKEVDKGLFPKKKYHVRRIGKEGKKLRVHSTVRPLQHNRRIHVLEDQTTLHQIDRWAVEELTESGSNLDEETLICVQINFERLVEGMNPGPAYRLLQQYENRVDQAMNRAGGMRTKLSLPPSERRTALICRFKEANPESSFYAGAARDLLLELRKWKWENGKSSEPLDQLIAQILDQLEVRIYVCPCRVKVAEDYQFPTILVVKEVSDCLESLNDCLPNKVTGSDSFRQRLEQQSPELYDDVEKLRRDPMEPEPRPGPDGKPTQVAAGLVEGEWRTISLRTISIFLASSAELREDRDAFDLFFRQKNDELRRRGIYLEIIRWEYFLDSMSESRKQDDYNKAVQECDVFVCLFFTKVGKFSKEEFSVAHRKYLETKRPFIFTYFKECHVRIGDESREGLNSLWDFKEKLKTLEHYPRSYKNIEDLKLQFSEQIERIWREIQKTEALPQTVPTRPQNSRPQL